MSQLNEVRRPLTTVFVDLVGSTPLSIELDEEDYAQVVADYRSIAGALADKHGGFIPRDEGDGRFFWFGWPTARRDDAHRAVAMATELVSAVTPLSDRVQAMCGRVIDVRVGIHTGSAIIATEADADFADVTGAAINLAAKVQAAAEPGTVLVSEATEAALGSRWMLEPAGSMTIDSLDGAIELARVVGLSEGHSNHGPFLGRADELARLDPTPGGATLVVGGAGLGKSRLLAEFVGSSSRSVLPVQAIERRIAEPFVPFLDALRAREDYAVAPLNPDDPAASLIERVLKLADTEPLVLGVEDLHWLDASSLDLLDRLIGLGDDRVTVVMTSRSVPTLGSIGRVELIELQPLDVADSLALLTEVAPQLSAEHSEELATRAAGNPFFLTWLARTAGERFEGVRRILRPRSGVPIVVQQAVRSQIDGSGVDDEVTSMAAVLGLDFRVGMLAAALGRAPGELKTDLDRLAQHGIVKEDTSASYRFTHSLVHELAYDLMLGAERRERHGHAADLCEELAPNDHALIGFHHDRAGRAEPAIRHKLAAAVLCRRSNAYAEAVTLTSRALELIDGVEDVPVDLALEARELHAVVSTSVHRDGYITNTSDASGVLELLGPDGDAGMIALAKTRDWTSAIATGDLRTVQRLNYEVYRTSQEAFPPIGPYNTNARALLAARRGRHVHAERLFERSVSQMVAQGLDPILGQNWATADDPIVLGIAYTAETLAVRGRLTLAHERLRQAAQRAETLPGGGPTIAHLAHTEATFHSSLGDGEATRAAAARLVELAQDLRLPIWEHQGGLHYRVAEALLAPSRYKKQIKNKCQKKLQNVKSTLPKKFEMSKVTKL